ncbi:hypothetical protein VIGAN_10108700 [Vigna angularis var. angularis]|uniref:Uncharacterized protein n=1 Tax=Vigna angularis var. angularis TaxID=157739 RepID=A0A0S3T3D4_PHAAN|nr:hypothetical protein VIGAN_10108700 [Vigna angularis var. angularis]
MKISFGPSILVFFNHVALHSSCGLLSPFILLPSDRVCGCSKLDVFLCWMCCWNVKIAGCLSLLLDEAAVCFHSLRENRPSMCLISTFSPLFFSTFQHVCFFLSTSGPSSHSCMLLQALLLFNVLLDVVVAALGRLSSSFPAATMNTSCFSSSPFIRP